MTAVNGNTVSISPALYVSYARSPLATRFSMGAKNAGVEDLQVYMNNTGFTTNFRMELRIPRAPSLKRGGKQKT